MTSEMVMLIIGSVLALLNSVIGLMIGHLFKNYAEMNKTIAENHTAISVANTNLANLTAALREHTETDRSSFEAVREQQRDMHLDNRRMLEEIRTGVRGETPRQEGGPGSRRPAPRPYPMRPA
jgi:hypothetical protein